MKKIFYLIVFVITLSSFGQEAKPSTKTGAYFGIKAGFNLVNSSHYNDGDHISLGYQIGAIYTIPISNKFSFQPELLLQSIGHCSKYINTYSNGTTSEETKLKNTYLQIPLNFKYAISNKFDVELGPNMAVLLNSKKTTHSEYNLDGTLAIFDGSSNNTSNLKKVGFGMNIGTSYAIAPNIYTGFRYTLMVASYQNIKNTMDNSIFAFSVGYNFR